MPEIASERALDAQVSLLPVTTFYFRGPALKACWGMVVAGCCVIMGGSQSRASGVAALSWSSVYGLSGCDLP